MFEARSDVGAAENSLNISDPRVVYGHRVTETREVKWLCIDKVYQKLNRPNFYDIGGTYMDNVADYWFSFKTEQVSSMFLIHLFICNRGLSSFNVSVSCHNSLRIDKKSNIAYLPEYMKEYQFKSLPELTHSYLTTYNFSELDVESLENKMLYIPVSFFWNVSDGISQSVIDKIKLNHDCGALLTDPVGSDFTIESADGAKFQVHKSILVANSEVFKAMLKDETAESQNGYVKFEDVNKHDLQCLLEFIYTGTIKDIENSNFINLFILGDRYDLKGLRELSQQALVLQLNTDNVFDILIISDMHECVFLKTETLKFIKINPDVLKSSSFKDIKNADLIREICSYLAS